MWVKKNIYKPMNSLESCKKILSPWFIFAALCFKFRFLVYFLYEFPFRYQHGFKHLQLKIL